MPPCCRARCWPPYVERQYFWDLQVSALPRQNDTASAGSLLQTIPPEGLILADLGYFSFRWFDTLTDEGYAFISRLRGGTRTEPVAVLTCHHQVRDSLVWLGGIAPIGPRLWSGWARSGITESGTGI